jgi:hypothetical protein
MYYDFVRLYFGTDLDCIKFVSEFVFVIRVSHELLAIIAINNLKVFGRRSIKRSQNDSQTGKV